MRLRGWLAAGVLSLVVGAPMSATGPEDGIVVLDGDWQSTVVRPEDEPTSPPEESRGIEGDLPARFDRWDSISLPDLTRGERELVFACYRGRLEVWLNESRIYRFDQPSRNGRRTIHTVALEEPAGKRLSIRLMRIGEGPSFDTHPLLATPDATPAALARLTSDPLQGDVGRIVAGVVLALVGLISVLASLSRWKLGERALLYFGLFTLIYGVRLVLDTVLPSLLGFPQVVRWYLLSGLTYLINVPATFFALQILGRGWKSSVLWMTRAAALFFAVGLTADLLAGAPFTADRANNVLVIANSVILVVNVARWKALRSADGLILTAGLAFFGILALLENVRALFDVFDWSEGIEWIGFLLLIMALGWVAFRRFLRTEAEVIELGKELDMARAIQKSILPSSPPAVDRLAIRARYMPMTAVAGDFYDYYDLPDGRVGVLIADVSGHGVPAAMVASMVKVAASTHAGESSDPAELMSMLNRTLCHHLGREFVTVSWMVFDPEGRTVRVCNAGHPPPLRLTNGSIRPLGAFGILVGKFRDAKYKAATVELEEGDRILCFTDGITEATNAGREEYGYSRLEAALASARSLDLDGALDSLLAEVKWWSGREQQGDDVTLVGIDVGGARLPA